MKNMDPQNTYHHEEKVFEMLENWKTVDAPDFIETRIMARLESLQISSRQRYARSLKWGWATLVVIVLLNGFAAAKYIKKSRSKNDSTYQQYLESSRTSPYNYYSAQS